MQFPQIMRDQLVGSGIQPSIYVGWGGLNPSADIYVLNVVQFRRSWSSAAT